MPLGTVRIPVRDAKHGGVVGWVMWDELGTFTEVDGVFVPSEFYLRCPGDPDEGQPSLQFDYGIRNGAPVCTAIRLESKTEGREVLPKDVEIVRRKLSNWNEVAITTVMRQSAESAPPLLERSAARRAYRDGRTRTRRKITDELLTEVAALYRDNIDNGPWRVIAERYEVSETTAGRYVLLARKAGLLPQTDPGKKNA
jgi:hypothetical protein